MALTCPIMLANCELWCKRYGEIGSGMLILVPTSSTILCTTVCPWVFFAWSGTDIKHYHMIHPRNGSVWLATTRATSFAMHVRPISPTTWLPAPSMLWINIGMTTNSSYPELWNREIEELCFEWCRCFTNSCLCCFCLHNINCLAYPPPMRLHFSAYEVFWWAWSSSTTPRYHGVRCTVWTWGWICGSLQM